MAKISGATSAFKTIVIVVLLAVVVTAGWLFYQRFQGGATVNSYRDCVVAGNPVQESYPEKCTTKDGETFTNPAAQVYQSPK